MTDETQNATTVPTGADDGQVRQARAFASFAIGRGLLKDDSLIAALKNYDLARDGSVPMYEQTAAVLVALSKNTQQLDPEVYLRATDPTRYWLGVAVRRVGLILFSLLLILMAAYASSMVSLGLRIKTDIAAISAIDVHGKARELMDAPAGRDKAAKLDETLFVLRHAASTYLSVDMAYRRLTCMAAHLYKPLTKVVDNQLPPCEGGPGTSDKPFIPQLLMASSPAVTLDYLPNADPSKLKRSIASGAVSLLPQSEVQRVSHYLVSNGIDIPATLQQQLKTIERETDCYMDFFGGWLLPVVCGLLGGLVYVMRMLLEPASNVGLKDIAIRVLAGGIAGLVVGWFLAPSALSSGSTVQITATPFGLAFFAGFSIDVLFTLMDRLKLALVQPVPPPSSGKV